MNQSSGNRPKKPASLGSGITRTGFHHNQERTHSAESDLRNSDCQRSRGTDFLRNPARKKNLVVTQEHTTKQTWYCHVTELYSNSPLIEIRPLFNELHCESEPTVSCQVKLKQRITCFIVFFTHIHTLYIWNYQCDRYQEIHSSCCYLWSIYYLTLDRK